jgi:ABC-2 type transport system ATP-binding protein
MDGAALPARIAEVLGLFELTKWEGELVESFSHGMKQRLVMCAAFLHRPRAVLVDEPMVGLDPRGARLIKEVFRTMSRHGVAILMSTHTLEVAEEMCDQISIILGGRIIARGTVEELRQLAGGSDEELTPVFLKLTGGSGLQEIEDVV